MEVGLPYTSRFWCTRTRWSEVGGDELVRQDAHTWVLASRNVSRVDEYRIEVLV